jgi:hypothetical protein
MYLNCGKAPTQVQISTSNTASDAALAQAFQVLEAQRLLQRGQHSAGRGLIDQILSRHSQVVGTMELYDMQVGQKV